MNKKFFLHLSFILLAFIYALPAFFDGKVSIFFPPDLMIHFNRMIGLQAIWKGPVDFSTFNAVGNPVNLFYPWLTFFPAYVFSRLSGSYVIGYILFVYFLTLVTFYLAYFCSKLFWGLTGKSFHLPSFLFAIIYVFSAYRSIDIFSRAAVGEYIAFSLIPLALVGFSVMLKGNPKSWIYLSAAMILIVYTHVLSVFIVSFFMILLGIISYKKIDSYRYIFNQLFKAIVVTFLGTSFFWVPFLDQSSIATNHPWTGILMDSAISPTFLIEGSLNNDFRTFTFGLVTLFLMVLSITNWKRFDFTMRSIVSLGLVATVMSTSLFPWAFFQNTSITLLQFTPRLLTIASFCFSLSGSKILANWFAEYDYKHSGVIVTVLLVSILNASSISTLKYNEKGNISESSDWVMIQKQVLNDYYPLQAIRHQQSIEDHKFFARGRDVKTAFYPYGNTVSFKPHINSGELDTPFIFTKGLRASSDGKSLLVSMSHRGTALIKVRGTQNITLYSTYTMYTKIAALVSLATGLFLIFVIFKKRQKISHI